ncbi:MAG TPA: SGNH/GDSL hydrolase family protein [Chitinophagaceae bacterium]
MILLSVIKFILNRVSPGSIIFHVNLITGLQWFLFLGLVCWILLHLIWLSARKHSFPFWLSWAIFLIIMAMGEWECYYLMSRSQTVSDNTHGYLLQYYLLYERELPEVQSECARYDPELTYTYKPGATCLQQAPEFTDTIYINRLGLRDDDSSLDRPKIICLGDSYTMGTGVHQWQTYAQVLEQTTGLKVLNAGVSSYGTAREMMLLKRLDTSALEFLIIQYCFNDIRENRTYLRRNFNLPVRSEKNYNKLVSDHKWATMYFPLKRVLTISRMVTKDLVMRIFSSGKNRKGGLNYDAGYVPQAAREFLDILYRSGINFSKVKVLVVDMNRYPVYDHRFIEAALKQLNSGSYSEDFKKSVRFPNISSLNDRSYFYPLDNHMNAAGHRLLATLIRNELFLNMHNR